MQPSQTSKITQNDVKWWKVDEGKVGYSLEDLLTQWEGVLADLALLAVQLRCHKLLVAYHRCQLRVSLAEQTAVVDVCRAADDMPVVDDHELGVDVDDLLDEVAHEDGPVPHAVERDVLGWIFNTCSNRHRLLITICLTYLINGSPYLPYPNECKLNGRCWQWISDWNTWQLQWRELCQNPAATVEPHRLGTFCWLYKSATIRTYLITIPSHSKYLTWMLGRFSQPDKAQSYSSHDCLSKDHTLWWRTGSNREPAI